MAKKNIDPFIASLLPESDKKMGAIAGVDINDEEKTIDFFT